MTIPRIAVLSLLSALACCMSSAQAEQVGRKPAAFIVEPASTWRFLPKRDLLPIGWQTNLSAVEFSGIGISPIGYGYPNLGTEIYAGERHDKIPAVYVATEFDVSIAQFAQQQNITLFLRCDDGCIAYINGFEVARLRIPDQDITTFAAESISHADGFLPFSIPVRKLRDGENTLAIEVHQRSPSSSDLIVDAALSPVNPLLVPK